jgi:D-lyxose ketol-isomerase
MFTVRNGNYNMKKYAKPYAEKLLIVEEGQITPFHFHFKKMEDIINRAGGNLLIEVFNSTPEGEKAKTPVRVSIDGHNFEVAAGTVLKILPGESITLLPGQYHQFWAEAGKGKILLGEVSSVNDDTSDNRFYDNIGRFPVIDEDEPALYFLSNEYPSVI